MSLEKRRLTWHGHGLLPPVPPIISGTGVSEWFQNNRFSMTWTRTPPPCPPRSSELPSFPALHPTPCFPLLLPLSNVFHFAFSLLLPLCIIPLCTCRPASHCSELCSPSPALYVTIEPAQSHFTLDWSQGPIPRNTMQPANTKHCPVMHLCFPLGYNRGTHHYCGFS